jgi:tetratricopeptide (TPR) repeat protein
MTGADPARLHAGIAEYGKVCALRGDHVAALMHYREAMSVAIRQSAPDVIVRHYLECALESLEHMGAYAEVLAYCERALEHYRAQPPGSALGYFDVASIQQRRGVVLLKQGRRDEAAQAFNAACETARSANATLPLAETLLRWITAQLTITADRLASEQARHHYCSVRADTVRPARAVPLPGHLSTTRAATGTREGGFKHAR